MKGICKLFAKRQEVNTKTKQLQLRSSEAFSQKLLLSQNFESEQNQQGLLKKKDFDSKPKNPKQKNYVAKSKETNDCFNLQSKLNFLFVGVFLLQV